MKDTIEIVPPALRRFVGFRPCVEDQYIRAMQMSFSMVTECLAGPRTPFGRIARNGLMLRPETQDYLYAGDYGHISAPYGQGRLPILERWIARYVRPGMSDGDKVVALSQSLYFDVPAYYKPTPVFLYGESDEETLLKGSGHCSCKSRVLVAMCQILGLQARPVMMWLWVDRAKDPNGYRGGHTIAEVRIDGRWGFFDPQMHFYCRQADGSFSSVAQIKANPELLSGMPEQLVAAMKPMISPHVTSFQHYWEKYLHPTCPTSIGRHDVNDQGQPHWHWATDEFRRRHQQDMARNRKILNDLADRGELTDEIYALGLNDFRARMGIADAVIDSLSPPEYGPAGPKPAATPVAAGAR